MNGWDEGDEGHSMATKAMKLVWESLQSTGDADNVRDVIYKNSVSVSSLASMTFAAGREGVVCRVVQHVGEEYCQPRGLQPSDVVQHPRQQPLRHL